MRGAPEVTRQLTEQTAASYLYPGPTLRKAGPVDYGGFYDNPNDGPVWAVPNCSSLTLMPGFDDDSRRDIVYLVVDETLEDFDPRPAGRSDHRGEVVSIEGFRLRSVRSGSDQSNDAVNLVFAHPEFARKLAMAILRAAEEVEAALNSDSTDI